MQPGEGTEDTKRRVSHRELLPDNPTRAKAVRKLIETLASRDARLITTDGTDVTKGAVEVAHEALIRGWTQLRKWVDAERTGLPIHRRLTADAKEWEDVKTDAKEDFLYTRVRLAVCREWAETHRDELNPIEGAFLTASEEAQRQREQDALENERCSARSRRGRTGGGSRERAEDAEVATERQRRLGYRFRVAAIVASLLALISVGLSLWANKARQDAKLAAKTADSHRIAAGLSEALERQTLGQVSPVSGRGSPS